MSLSLLRQSKQSKSKAPLRRPVRLGLERLEDRLALSGGIFTPDFYNGPIASLPPVSDQVSALSAAYALTAYLPWDGPKALQSAGLQFGTSADASALQYRSSATGQAATAWNDIMQARSLLNQEVALYNQQPQLGWADPNTYNGGHGTAQEHQLASQAEQLLWDAYNIITALPTQTTGTGGGSGGTGSGGTGSGGNNGGSGGGWTLQGYVQWVDNTWQQFVQGLGNVMHQVDMFFYNLGQWWYAPGGPMETTRDAVVPTMGMGLVTDGLGVGIKALPGIGPLAIKVETAVGDWLGSAGPAISKWFSNLGPAVTNFFQQFVTKETAAAEQATASQLAVDLFAKYGGSVSKSLPEINQMSLPQDTVVDTITNLFNMSGRKVGDTVVMSDGTKVLTSRMLGTGQPVIGVNPQGKAVLGTATISFDYDTMTSVVTNINLPWGQ
jgi:hypothetical protein